MGIATPSQLILKKSNSLNSMAQYYHHHHHQGMFNFSNVFERSQQQEHQQEHQQQIAQQIRRDKLRVTQGFEPHPLLVTDDVESSGSLPGYETAGMLSEMFNFTPGATTPTEHIQLAPNYPNSKPPPPPATPTGCEWYSHRQAGGTAVGGFGSLDESKVQNLMNGDSAAAAMHLFLMNPHEPRSPPSPSQSNFQNPPSISSRYPLHHHDHHQVSPISPARVSSQFTWVPADSSSHGIGGVMEGQGLSLSLSSSLQHLEVSKAEELKMGDHGSAAMLFFHQGGGGSNNTSAAQYPYKNLGGAGENHQVHVGIGSYGLRNSKYARAAQELLEEFCSVGRGQLIKKKLGRNNSIINPNTNTKVSDGGDGGGSSGGGGNSSSPSKDLPPLSAADRVEHQRRKVKLLCMLDEVDRRYNHYCEQMQMVVNAFDLVMGFGAAVPYTALAQKAMSRHFRCLKDAIAAQLKHSCELLGEKDAGTSGVTKGETPRLKLLEQGLRQQRAIYQMGMMEQEAWRPQRGLPERSVNILRAWLFEHFLHPYPSDADKHLLARQTGLSRNQVSNWFINARVRLWKPMVEDMYQQEAKEEAEERESNSQIDDGNNNNNNIAQTPTPNPTITTTPSSTAATPIATTTATGRRSEINDPENDPSFFPLNKQCFSENQAKNTCLANPTVTPAPMSSQSCPASYDSDEASRRSAIMTSGNAEMGSTLIRFGTSAGDVSLTLGLRHAGNVRDFGGC